MSGPERHWYRLSWLSIALLPPAALFGLVTRARRMAYRLGLLPSIQLPVPVIVVGNITAGGTGKTPLTLWLCEWLREQGYRPGIVSRGYGGSRNLQPVTADSNPGEVGDEPLLLARRCRCPIWVGRDRVAAAQALLAANRECNIILSDDGLQHYRMRRDIEIAVVDGSRGLGNGLMLPAGPLREGKGRLKTVDAVVVNGEESLRLPIAGSFRMSLEGATFENLLNPQYQVAASEFRGRRVRAIAGIGNPLRFFQHLQRLGVSFTAHAFPDHHSFLPADLEFADANAIIMTEKDAIKCRQFARESHWMLTVDAHVDAGLGQLILDRLKTRHGS